MGLFFEAFLLGLVGGAVPGPILTGTFAEILNSNFIKGLRIIFLALIIETIGALLTIYIFYKLGFSKTVVQVISICGAIVLFWLASSVWNINKINSESKKVLSFYQIVILTALNSGYWVFWITIGVPKALLLNNILVGGKFIFLVIFEFGWLVATTVLAFIFYKFRPLLEKKNLVGVTFKILALVLVILGIKTLLSIF
jgi:threonine/homoserine/homoserine lactone efflux protein